MRPVERRESYVQNIAEFRLIGRVGRIDVREKVAHVDVASDYHRRSATGWLQDTHWNRVTLFGRLVRRAAQLIKGDIIHVTGRVRQNGYERDGGRIPSVELIAARFACLGRTAEAVPRPARSANDDEPCLAALSAALVGYGYLVDEFEHQRDPAALETHGRLIEKQAAAVRALLERTLASPALIAAFHTAGYTGDYLRGCPWSPELADAVYDVRHRRGEYHDGVAND
ncbi:single-stranded DNA-binding protein [Sphingomonas sp. RIT328]|uniref:single-stranded DNA-binding protein n=1 Tax=Sphingomonas sp. RIT328 TaxID=1470591 RepID=UPI001F355255|nr:single-stranded DNA-binding protein [Sphingomonas sp. RIT328]